ncbi:DNA mismatch endonuclease Vsr [Tannerella forsythia]|jgi:DNA mismatch endonuclease vsr|uniref:very short patch repair endonuclease n=1 Tax=Tannerella forsythia TaxID=28112 RepID=UPI000A9C43D9|nr:DNA mismatch endonuclease Vsr [Tannerella forsythia]
MDVFSKSKRSDIMSKVSGKDTKPEVLVRKFLFSKGFRYRKNVKDLQGKPDIVLPKYKTIIFVHGCFWHGHENCEAAKLPASNIEYWTKKVTSNVTRDSQNIQSLKKTGWNVIIIWECELKVKNREKRLDSLVNEILDKI